MSKTAVSWAILALLCALLILLGAHHLNYREASQEAAKAQENRIAVLEKSIAASTKASAEAAKAKVAAQTERDRNARDLEAALDEHPDWTDAPLPDTIRDRLRK